MKKFLSFLVTAVCALTLFSCTVNSASTDNTPDTSTNSGTSSSGTESGTNSGTESGTETGTESGAETGTNSGTDKESGKESPDTVLNPEPYQTRNENLDFIFDPDQLGQTDIYITRKEWNTLLVYYDISSSNEEYVHADFQFKKGDYTWKFTDIGLRVRGKTSRRRPQSGEGETAFTGYNNNYVQSHFKVDFEEWLKEDQGCKMAGCMKGMNLKHFKGDPTHAREVYGYNLFRQNGIWTSPRAAYTKLTIHIADSDGSTEDVYFGLYAMIEEINKQFLKARKSGKAEGDFLSDEGNLWKCTGGASFSNPPANYETFGVEEKRIENLYIENPDQPWKGEIRGNPVENTFTHDLKTNKKSFTEAKNQLDTFTEELSKLDSKDSASIKAWFNKKMDVDLFLRTYAINVILGMWDDYWISQNNFYFYFDTGSGSNAGTEGKAYFIPYDYDNILGCCYNFDAGKQNPLEWGPLYGNGRPLIQKMLAVPEFMELYKKYLLEYSDSDSLFDVTKSQERLNKWKNMVESSIYSSQIDWVSESYSEWGDYFADWGYNFTKYKLFNSDQNTNFFMVRQKTIEEACSSNPESNTSQEPDILPAYKDGDQYTFFFVPEDFGFNFDGSQTVCIRGSFNEWGKTELNWDAEKKYYTNTITIEEPGDYPYYKFWYDNGSPDGSWLGLNEYRRLLPDSYTQTTNTGDFRYPE